MAGPRNNDTPVAASTPSIHALVSKTILPKKELDLLGKMADFMPGARNLQEELGTTSSARK